MSARSRKRRQAKRRAAPVLALLAALKAHVEAHGLVCINGQWVKP